MWYDKSVLIQKGGLRMKELREAILRDGVGIGSEIIKVDMFLNHRLDTELLTQIGEAFRRDFADARPDMVLTIEASGIAAAITTAQAFGNLPVIFAKKGAARNQGDDVYQSSVFSFTRQQEFSIRVSKKYLPAGSRVLIIDDFLANGEAAEGLCDIARQADAEVVGVGVCIEKGFQPGGQRLRNEGYHVVSLATVTGIRDGKPVLEDEPEA